MIRQSLAPHFPLQQTQGKIKPDQGMFQTVIQTKPVPIVEAQE